VFSTGKVVQGNVESRKLVSANNWHVTPHGSCKNRRFEEMQHLELVRTDVSEKRSASIMRVTRIIELGTTLAVN
jgi:hypothetical protein